jgi:cobalt/nickel transport system ATP-binding protein
VENNDLTIHLKNITFSYPGCDPVLEKLNLQFKKGSKIGLMGPNGSGKTTLFMGLLKPSAGKIEIFNTPVETENDFRKVREKIGLLFQDADDQLFSPTVLEDVAFGPLNLGKTKSDAMDIAKNTLDFLGLNGFEERITYKLSGGEKKLVSLATVLAMEPEVLLLDEPTSGLDDKTKEMIKNVLMSLDLSYILISHEIDEIQVHHHVHAHAHGAYEHEHD